MPPPPELNKSFNQKTAWYIQIWSQEALLHLVGVLITKSLDSLSLKMAIIITCHTEFTEWLSEVQMRQYR